MPSPKAPLGLCWRSSTLFILITVAVGIFTDLFLYGLIVPIMPFLLQERLDIPQSQVQSYSSALLATFAGASVLFSLPAGYIADRTSSRRLPFLSGIAALFGATLLLSVGRTMPVLVLSRFLQGVSGAVVWTVGLAMVMDTVGVKHLGKVMGTIFSVVSVGELAAPVIGGVLYEKAGFGGVFGISAGLLVLDFLLRLLVIEKKSAARYQSPKLAENENSTSDTPTVEDHFESAPTSPASESSPLLSTSNSNSKSNPYLLPAPPHPIFQRLPILSTLRSPRLLTALFLTFTQALTLGTFDATIPTEAASLFGFTALKSGLLFIALDIPYLILGPLAGWTVDRYGPKPAAVLGFAYLAPMLVLLRLPTSGGTEQISLYAGLLALCGVGMGTIGSPSVVEMTDVVEKFAGANPKYFGDNGPYAQLYGMNSLVFSLGLTVGPVLAGLLRDRIGYGNMNAVVAGLVAGAAVLSFIYVGGKPGMLRRKSTA